MERKKKSKFKCKSEAQKNAIMAKNIRKTRRNGGVKSEAGCILVTIKNHGDKNGGHPHIIVEDIEDNHVSVGLSTKKKKGKKGGMNYAMEKSPLNDGKNSYMRRQGTVAPKKEYSQERTGSMTTKDYGQAKIYAERAKQKYLAKKKNKKK